MHLNCGEIILAHQKNQWSDNKGENNDQNFEHYKENHLKITPIHRKIGEIR